MKWPTVFLLSALRPLSSLSGFYLVMDTEQADCALTASPLPTASQRGYRKARSHCGLDHCYQQVTKGPRQALAFLPLSNCADELPYRQRLSSRPEPEGAARPRRSGEIPRMCLGHADTRRSFRTVCARVQAGSQIFRQICSSKFSKAWAFSLTANVLGVRTSAKIPRLRKNTFQ